MFSSKYIFETKETRTSRYLKNGFLYLFSSIFIYIISGYFFILLSDNENKKTEQKFFKTSPDLIVIFTGDNGRIPYGIKLAKKFNQSNIFITGVYNKNSVETLLNPLQLGNEIDGNLLEIDYFARNTVENCLSTLRYLRQKKGFKEVLVISHDYHIPRIKVIFNKILTEDDPYEIFYSGFETDYSEWRNLKILYTEVYKFIRTYAFLMIWDSESESLTI
ncbi:MAG: YdcF family protein [Bacteriovoracaceae bacterium]|nr:YdcF family protein [Bacteriovoracaceae bacterium]